MFVLLSINNAKAPEDSARARNAVVHSFDRCNVGDFDALDDSDSDGDDEEEGIVGVIRPDFHLTDMFPLTEDVENGKDSKEEA